MHTRVIPRQHNCSVARFALAPTQPSWRRTALVAGLGIIGVASLLASNVVPPEVAQEAGIPMAALRLIVLIQPTILVIGAAILGDRLTRTTWLQAPLLTGSHSVSFRSILTGGLVGAIVVGVVLALYTWITTEVSPTTLVSGSSLSLITGVLYGGLTEEVLMRWGLMSALVWAMVKIRRIGPDRPPTQTIVTLAIIVTAVAFALLHLPALLALTDPSITVVLASMVANLLAGCVFGYLFAARGLEAAMVAHAGAHVVGTVLTAVALG